MVTWKLVSWLRMALLSVLALIPLAQHRGPGAEPGASRELVIDVDGDGRADRVRWTRYGDAWWLDVEVEGTAPHQTELRSTTRVASAGTGDGWSLSAADVNCDGRTDVLLRDPAGHTTAWVSDGLGFVASGTAE